MNVNSTLLVTSAKKLGVSLTLPLSVFDPLLNFIVQSISTIWPFSSLSPSRSRSMSPPPLTWIMSIAYCFCFMLIFSLHESQCLLAVKVRTFYHFVHCPPLASQLAITYQMLMSISSPSQSTSATSFPITFNSSNIVVTPISVLEHSWHALTSGHFYWLLLLLWYSSSGVCMSNSLMCFRSLL